jgi:hypothetical protein
MIDTKDTYGLLTTSQSMQKDLGRDMFQDVKLMHENNFKC